MISKTYIRKYLSWLFINIITPTTECVNVREFSNNKEIIMLGKSFNIYCIYSRILISRILDKSNSRFLEQICWSLDS